MSPSSTTLLFMTGQHDTKYVTSELLLDAAFVADEIGVIRVNQLVGMLQYRYWYTVDFYRGNYPRVPVKYPGYTKMYY